VAAALAIYFVGFADAGKESTREPSGSPTGTATTPKPSRTDTAPDGAGGDGDEPRATTGRTYTVKAGDVLSRIAEETGVSIDDLERFNPGLDARSLRVGRRLRLSG